jgi:hypothetical protein
MRDCCVGAWNIVSWADGAYNLAVLQTFEYQSAGEATVVVGFLLVNGGVIC